MTTKIDANDSKIFQDLIAYTNVNPQLAIKRCDYAATELAILWNNKKNILKFYQDNNLYIYDLTKYQLILEHHNMISEMIKQIKELRLNKILEFGGGIGEFSINCAKNNLEITYYDLDGTIKNYALWRFKKHKCNVKIAEEYPLNQKWDLVNVMDVLEHLENPQEIISDLSKNTKYIFCNPEEVKYNIYFPQHISKFDLTEHFTQIKGYLWKNKTPTGASSGY